MLTRLFSMIYSKMVHFRKTKGKYSQASSIVDYLNCLFWFKYFFHLPLELRLIGLVPSFHTSFQGVIALTHKFVFCVILENKVIGTQQSNYESYSKKNKNKHNKIDFTLSRTITLILHLNHSSYEQTNFLKIRLSPILTEVIYSIYTYSI